MTKPSYPGVYIKEDPSGVRPIEGVGTSTAAFVGETQKGPVDRAGVITHYSEYQATYGDSLKTSCLAECVQQFFDNGGTRLYVVRVMPQTGAALSEQDYQKALLLLDAIVDINIIAVPGVGSPSMVSYAANYCEKRGNCFFIGDMDASYDTVARAKEFMDCLTTASSHAAVYFPWLVVKDAHGAQKTIPPSGSVAGIYARTDTTRGVWKSPAGPQATVNGAVSLSVNVTQQEQDGLNPLGVNVIRDFPDKGILVWGGRTLATKVWPEFRYVPVRRTAIYTKQSIVNGIQWAVFEPNDASLWSRLEENISRFMHTLFRAGALVGQTQEEAYYVRCGLNETMTQTDILNGVVIIEVGFAPLRPAEFVIVKIQQIAGQDSTA